MHRALMGSQGGSCCSLVCTGKAILEGVVMKGRDLSQVPLNLQIYYSRGPVLRDLRENLHS